MSKKRIIAGVALLFLLLVAAFCASLAEDQGLADPSAAETPMPALAPTDDLLTDASAANAARLYRSGGESEAFAYWETALGHVPKTRMQKKVTVAMLKNAVGLSGDAEPVGRAGIQFQECYEVPMLKEGDTLQRDLDFNLHGSVYADSPLVSVTATFASKADKGKTETQTVTFDPASDIRSYSLVSALETKEEAALDDLVDISKLPEGRYAFTLTAATVAQATPVTLKSAEVKIEKTFPYQLTQNKFDDNYSEALAFFGGDASKLSFTYTFRNKGRNVSTQTTWREANMVDTEHFGRTNAASVPYFEKAYAYMNDTYFKVDVVRSNGEIRTGRVTLLYDIMDKKASGYAPRFQSNLQYVSHHTLGTAIDVNENLYPNMNIITNHELIGDDVKNNLEYRGIKTDEKGRTYYDFCYTGSYKAYFERVPKTIVNYLLYELAFFRAGFEWGYYYETACDAMHFMLTENDRNKHMDSEVGLRKIWVYADDTEEVIAAENAALEGREATQDALADALAAASKAAEAEAADAAASDVAASSAVNTPVPEETEETGAETEAEEEGGEPTPTPMPTATPMIVNGKKVIPAPAVLP